MTYFSSWEYPLQLLGGETRAETTIKGSRSISSLMGIGGSAPSQFSIAS
jgi:hypothetical protein